MELLYSFKFNNNYVFEMHYTNVAEDAPKYLKYQWFLHFDNNLIKLQFDKMDDNTRYFKNNIMINLINKNLLLDNKKYELKSCTDEDNQVIYIIMKTSLIN